MNHSTNDSNVCAINRQSAIKWIQNTIQCRSTYTTTWCGGRINGWSQNWSDILVVFGRKMTDAIHFLAKKKVQPFYIMKLTDD